MKKRLLYILLLLLFFNGLSLVTIAQQGNVHVFNFTGDELRTALSVAGYSRYSAILPLNAREVTTDTLSNIYDRLAQKASPGVYHLLSRHAFSGGSSHANVTLDPIFDLWSGAGGKKLSAYGGAALGLQATGDFWKHLSIGGYLRFNQASFPDYYTDDIKKMRVVPGMGYARPSAMGGYYFWDWDVYARLRVLKYFDLEAGMGRNFWGDGYRTFFLSDNSFSYPYVKLSTTVWHIKYVCLYAFMKDMQSTTSGRWGNMENKFSNLHFLSWDISKRVNLGFFEAVIYQPNDTAGRRGFDVSYVNPLLFFRPVEYSIGSPDNSLMGVSLKVKIAKKNFIYGQFLMDDIIVSQFTSGSLNRIRHWLHPDDSTLQYGYWTNKQAWQLGFSSSDIFHVKGLNIRLEYNAARPYTFSHRRVIVNYAHYNEALAHPAGANFTEVLGFLHYRYKRWYFEGQGLYRLSGIDTTGTHYGQDIFQSTFDTYYPELNNIPVSQYDNNIGQGLRTELWYTALRAAWLVNYNMNLRIEGEFAWRHQTGFERQDGFYLTLGIKSSTYNPRWDR